MEKHSPEDPLKRRIIGAAIEVHRALGAGLLESSYEACLEYELQSHGLVVVRRQRLLPVTYKGVHLDHGYRLDMVVEEQVIVELKAVDALTKVHEAQILTYLRLSGYQRGLLINFNVLRLVNGVRRFAMSANKDR